MIVSNAVSENTLPALSKMLEMYIAVYMENDIMNTVNGKFGGPKPSLRYKIKRGKIIGESIDLSEADEESVLPGTKRVKSEKERIDAAMKTLDAKRHKLADQEKQIERELERLQNAKDRSKSQDQKNKIDRQKFSYQRQMDRVKQAQDALDREARQTQDAAKTAIQQSREKREKEKHENEMKTKASKVDVVTSDKTISIEPTTLKIHKDKY